MQIRARLSYQMVLIWFSLLPYIGLIDYHEQHKYAYELLSLKNNETKEIGHAKWTITTGKTGLYQRHK